MWVRWRWGLAPAAAAAVLALLASGAHADTVSLDSSFGSSGIVAVDSGETFDAVAVQPDGKEIVTGTTGSGSSAMIRRYNRDGSVDTSFGTNGETTLAVPDGTETAQPQFRGIVLLASGAIELVGDVYLTSASQREIVVVRLTSAGTLDTTFGTSGYQLVDVGSTLRFVAAALPETSGDIVVVTSTGLIAAIDSSGALDSAFATGGVATDTGMSLYGGALQSDGSILVVGESGFGSAGPAIVQRFTSAGVLDTSFGSGGTITTDNDTESCAVTTDSQGRIVVAGETSSGWLVVDRRLASDGSLDASFAGSGTLTTSVHLQGAESVRDCTVLTRSDDSILVGGTGTDPSNGATVDLLAHIDADGSLDSDFGSSGFFRTSVNHKNATGLAARSDGSLVQAGQGGMAGYTLTAAQAPTAAFTTSTTGLQVAVDASGSTNAASYAWDFGDGATATGATASHTYASAGTYTVTLTVTDSGGATDSVSHDVTATALPPANQPPTASFTSSTSGLTSTFDASASSDIDGTIDSYAWDFGDGSTGTGAHATHTYAGSGDYTVTLTVTDDGGATDSISHAVSAGTADLTQLASPSDCIAETNAEGCGTTSGAGLDGADWIAASPDGKNVYVASFDSGVAEFSRDSTSGALTEIGCVAARSTTECSTSSFSLSEATSVTVSPDGQNVYVTASDDDIVDVFDRATDGTLTLASCIQDSSARFDRGCATRVHGMGNPYDVAISDDGKNAYVAAGGGGQSNGAIVELARADDGSLSQLASPDDCIEETGSTDGACGTTGTGLLAATALAISPDGTSVYVVADTHAVRSGDAPGAIAELSRDPATGALTQAGCIGEATNVTGITECQTRTAGGLSDLVNVAVSPDGKTVYTASDDTDGAIAAFSRATDGVLTPLGCVAGGGGTCGQTVAGLTASFGLAVSPDGADVYVAAAGSSTVPAGIVELARAADGTLSGSACIQQAALRTPTCAESDGHGLADALGVAVSPDGGNVYVATSSDYIPGTAGNGGAVAAFARAATAVPPSTIEIVVTATGSGTITSTPSGIACPGACSATFAQGTQVTLTAAPSAGTAFSGWTGDCSGTGSCTLDGASDEAVGATFAATPATATLTVTNAGGGTVTSAPNGISCGTTCTASFASGTLLDLMATPDSSHTFAGWQGDCSGDGSCEVTMAAAHTVTAVFAAAGIDTSFGTNGIAAPPSCGSSTSMRGVAAEPDESLAAVVFCGTQIALAKYTAQGALDTTFGTSGLVMTPLTAVDQVDGPDGTAIATQPDGKILVGGVDGGSGFGVARYNADGTPDSAWGTSGVVKVPTPFATADAPRRITVLDDGDVLVTGQTASRVGYLPVVVRLTADGSIDTTFAPPTGVLLSTAYGGEGRAATFDAGGNLLLEGWLNGAELLRYSAAGALDTPFAIATQGLPMIAPCGVFAERDGRILVAGVNPAYQPTLERLEPDGSVDTTFGQGGYVYLPWQMTGATYHDLCSVVQRPDGRIVFGATDATGAGTYAVGVVDDDGTPMRTGNGIYPLLATTGVTGALAWGLADTPEGVVQSGSAGLVRYVVPSPSLATSTNDLSVSVTGNTSALIESSATGIHCGTTCTAAFPAGATVVLQAKRLTDWQLTWGGDCSGHFPTCVVTMSQARTVTATYTRTPFMLHVDASGGTVTSSPAGIDCSSSDCSSSFPDNTQVTLTATPSAGRDFIGWDGGGCTGTGTCTVTLSGSVTVTAVFEAPLNLTINGSGFVFSYDGKVQCSRSCTVHDPSLGYLEAQAPAGGSFQGWSGDCSGRGLCQVTEGNVTANFGPVAAPPGAAFVATPSSTPGSLTVSVDASLASGPDGIDQYDWDWGDHTVPACGNRACGKTETHTYSSPGTYTISLRTHSSDGESGRSSAQVTVPNGPAAGETQPPVARFTAAPIVDGNGKLTVVLDGRTSTGASSWTWDFGDGSTASSNSGLQPFPNEDHDYATGGTYTITFTITDAAGVTATATQTVSGGTSSTTQGGGSLTLEAGGTPHLVSWSSTAFKQAVSVQVIPVPAPTPVGGRPGATPVQALELLVKTAAGTPVTTFSSPIQLTFQPVNGVVPAYSIDGKTWTSMPHLKGTTLPKGYKDGWYRDGSGNVHVLTLHATYFGLNSAAASTPELAATARASVVTQRGASVRVRATLPATAVLVLRRGSVVLAKARGAVGGGLTRTFVLPLRRRPPTNARLTVVVSAGGLRWTKVLPLRGGR